MKVCIVYGSPRKQNTFAAAQVVKEQLKKHGDVEFTEFFLPKDMPQMCKGCLTCVLKDETKCPDYAYIKPIADAIKEADGLIFTSPVYVMDVSGQLKALLDHFPYYYMIHRPRPEMFRKTAMAISTAAGAGTKDTNATIKRNLSWWGVSKIYSCGVAVRAKSWNTIPEKRRIKIENQLKTNADAFYHSMQKKPRVSLSVKLKFYAMKFMVKKIPASPVDKSYWQQQGWLNGKHPW